MTNISKHIKIAALILVIFISGCMLTKGKNDKNEVSNNSGLKLWEQNCSRCHNVPEPASLSDNDWDIVGAHMRVRAYLTEKEADEIIKFLQSIN